MWMSINYSNVVDDGADAYHNNANLTLKKKHFFTSKMELFLFAKKMNVEDILFIIMTSFILPSISMQLLLN